MLASARLTEEGVEGVISSPNGLVTWHLAIGLNAVFQAIELPAGIADLDTCLANVDRDTLARGCCLAAAGQERLLLLTARLLGGQCKRTSAL